MPSKRSEKRQTAWCPKEEGAIRERALHQFFLDGRILPPDQFFAKGAGKLNNSKKEILKNQISKEDWPKFLRAFEDEWSEWLRLGAGSIIEPEQAKDVPEEDIIGSRPVFTDRNAKHRNKNNPDIPVKPKARIVTRGDQERLKEQLRKDSPTGSLLGAHTVTQTAVSKRWVLRKLDAKNAYFQGPELERDVYSRPPKGYNLPGVREGSLIKAARSIYGFLDGARKFWLWVKSVFLSLGALISAAEGAFFYIKDEFNRLIGLFMIHVDDVLFSVDDTPEDPDFHEGATQ